ncbi:hypothetical protein TNCT_422791 [Trichonephila clavata]|uniref:EGF-like domain-containing protein n=1 Tax=Trichonephila clavata TaxID=2740835 RepID=A0A8X6FMQ4_TRICU|nr:hypothetical protein TNCT_422791 [Trichonephila clavata]
MRGVLLLGWITCWTVVCNCHDGRMDSGAFEATTDMDDYVSDLLKEDFLFLGDKDACSKDDDCKNKGSCGEDKKCSCKNGTSGELCEIITGCDELKCTADISECVLDEEEEKGACQCKDESKVYFNGKCVGK